MAAGFLTVALISSSVWYAWHSSGLMWHGIVSRVVIVSFCAAAVGKIVGLMVPLRWHR
jgi:hypothetical protein